MSLFLSFSRLLSTPAKYSKFASLSRFRLLNVREKQNVGFFADFRLCLPACPYSWISRDHDLRSNPPSIENTTPSCPVIPPGPILRTDLPPSPGQVNMLARNSDTDVCSRQRVRTIVLCFDGTDEQFDLDNSNVVNFFSALHKGDHARQVVYYQSGFGTFTIPQVATPLYTGVKKLLDLLFAKSINHHVMSGYKFLMDNYKPGDHISMFGFSRGAYTARALAGMVHKVGLLPAGNELQVPFAYKMYTDESEVGFEQSAAFKKAFCLDAHVDFVGVWETIASIGLSYTDLPFTHSNTAIKVFRHALALDERRVKFKPSHYQRCSHGIATCTEEEEKPPNTDKNKWTDVKEVWFAGAHGDVGGGSVKNTVTANLARMPLRWMIRECFRSNTSIQFDAGKLEKLGLDPNTLWPDIKKPVIDAQSRAGSLSFPAPSIIEREASLADIRSSSYDQLRCNPLWWVLEYFPLQERVRHPDGKWRKYRTFNRGRPRSLPEPYASGQERVLVHRSVQVRMQLQDAGCRDSRLYKPKVYIGSPVNVEWID